MEEEYLKHVSSIGVDSLRVLMEKYGEAVWQYAYFLTKKHDLADDIAQEVFIKAFLNFSSFRGESNVKTWLMKITRNTAFSFRKKSFFRRITLVDVISGTSPSAEEEFLEKHLANEIWLQVLKLPIAYREVLILNALHELTVSEIAETLGVPEGTVKSRIHRARIEANQLLRGGFLNEGNGRL